jgi:choline-phosphate cytidylyltransferase
MRYAVRAARLNHECSRQTDSIFQDNAFDNDRDTGPGPSPLAQPPIRAPAPVPIKKAHPRHLNLDSSDTGMDSPTYDGDVESTSTAAAAALNHTRHLHHRSLLSTSTLNSPSQSLTPSATMIPTSPGPAANGTTFTTTNHSLSRPTIPIIVPDEPAPVPAAANAFNPASLTDTDIQAYVQSAIDGEPHRPYKINRPPTNRPIRVYADGWFLSLSFLP